MLRLDNDQPSLWESVLTPEFFEMSEELAKIDRILGYKRFFARFRGEVLYPGGKADYSRSHLLEEDVPQASL